MSGVNVFGTVHVKPMPHCWFPETQVVSRQYNSGLNVVATDHNDIYVTAVWYVCF